MYPLAALVFFASIAIPMLKLVGLAVMLVTTQTGRSGWLRDRTRLYHVVRGIGRWSMIDIFMEALLGALVQFGSRDHDRTGYRRGCVLCRSDPHHVRGRDFRPATNVGCGTSQSSGCRGGLSCKTPASTKCLNGPLQTGNRTHRHRLHPADDPPN